MRFLGLGRYSPCRITIAGASRPPEEEVPRLRRLGEIGRRIWVAPPQPCRAGLTSAVPPALAFRRLQRRKREAHDVFDGQGLPPANSTFGAVACQKLAQRVNAGAREKKPKNPTEPRRPLRPQQCWSCD